MTKKRIGLTITTMLESPEQQTEDPHDNRSPSKGDPRINRCDCERLDEAILQSLPIGIVAFDRYMRIIEANPQAAKLIELGDHIDQSLARGTDDEIWQGWRQQLKSAISAGRPVRFDDGKRAF